MITISGYLTQAKLAQALQQLVPDGWLGHEVAVTGSRHRWDMAYQRGGNITVVEYDGDEHYRHSLKIKVDRVKNESARTQGSRVVRFPYWVQLDSTTLWHYFRFEAEIEQSFPHGFITTKLFPASFCELGIERFRTELSALPAVVRDAVVASLRERVEEHGLEFVLPSSWRASSPTRIRYHRLVSSRQHAGPGPAGPDIPEPSLAERARTLASLGRIGSLSPPSRKPPGFPFGSMMPYAVDQHGRARVFHQQHGNAHAEPAR